MKPRPLKYTEPTEATEDLTFDPVPVTIYDLPTGGGGGGAVDSVNGQTGEVNLSAEDVGALASDYEPPAPTYAEITGKPATFPPVIGTTATTAKAGDYVPSYAEITGKPATFPPASHTHPISEVLDLQDHLDGAIKRATFPDDSGYVSYYEGSASQGDEIVGGRVTSEAIIEDDIIRVELDTGLYSWLVEPGFRPGVLVIEDTDTFEYAKVSGAVEILVEEGPSGSTLTAYFWTPVSEMGIVSPAYNCTLFF